MSFPSEEFDGEMSSDDQQDDMDDEANKMAAVEAQKGGLVSFVSLLVAFSFLSTYCCTFQC